MRWDALVTRPGSLDSLEMSHKISTEWAMKMESYRWAKCLHDYLNLINKCELCVDTVRFLGWSEREIITLWPDEELFDMSVFHFGLLGSPPNLSFLI